MLLKPRRCRPSPRSNAPKDTLSLSPKRLSGGWGEETGGWTGPQKTLTILHSTDVMVFNAGLADRIRLLFCRTSGSPLKTCSSTVQSHSYKTKWWSQKISWKKYVINRITLVNCCCFSSVKGRRRPSGHLLNWLLNGEKRKIVLTYCKQFKMAWNTSE